MSNDGGMAARIEAWFVAQLKTLTFNDKPLFKNDEEVDHWRHQIASSEAGIESFDRYAPFAFVKWQPVQPDREGGYDLNQKLRVAIAVGQTARAAGDARLGSDNAPGTSVMHSLIINLFDGKHPGAGFTCDDFYYAGDAESVDHPKRHGIELYFEANYLKD